MTKLLIALSLLGSSLACFPPLVPPTPAAKCEDGWSHLGTKCYKLFTEKVLIIIISFIILQNV